LEHQFLQTHAPFRRGSLQGRQQERRHDSLDLGIAERDIVDFVFVIVAIVFKVFVFVFVVLIAVYVKSLLKQKHLPNGSKKQKI